MVFQGNVLKPVRFLRHGYYELTLASIFKKSTCFSCKLLLNLLSIHNSLFCYEFTTTFKTHDPLLIFFFNCEVAYHIGIFNFVCSLPDILYFIQDL